MVRDGYVLHRFRTIRISSRAQIQMNPNLNPIHNLLIVVLIIALTSAKVCYFKPYSPNTDDIKSVFGPDAVPIIVITLKPGLHESQLQVEWSVILLYSLVVERHC